MKNLYEICIHIKEGNKKWDSHGLNTPLGNTN
jgi:hypothetical protein